MPSPLPPINSPTGTIFILPPELQLASAHPSPLSTHHNFRFAHPVAFESREHENHCSMARMEQSVLDFIKSMLMDEEKLPDAHTCKPCISGKQEDIEDHAHAVVLYKAIMKDFCDILTEHDDANGRNLDCSSTTSEFIDQSVDLLQSDDPFNYYSISNTTPSAGGDSLHLFMRADHPLHAREVGGMHSLHSARDIITVSDRCTAAGHNCDRIADSGYGVNHFRGDHHQSSSDSSIEFGRWAEQLLSSATLVTNVDAAHDLLQRPVPVVQRQWRTFTRDYIDKTKMNVGSSTQAPARDLQLQQEKSKMEKPDFSFVEDLGKVIEAEYENLYAKGSDGDVSAVRGRRGVRGCRPSRGKRKESASVSAPGYYDLEELLISCAQAVSRSEMTKAREILQGMERLGVSAKGRSCLHRMVFHFCRALKARLDGTGAALYAAELAATNVTAGDSVRSWIYTFDRWHYMKISHFFANQTFLAASHGRNRVHIVDYGICYGMQWPYLIKALSEREAGPPFLIITGVQFSKRLTSICDESAMSIVAETGRRLADFAAACNVPFRFHGVASSSWEDLDAESLGIELDRRSETALVVNVMRQLFFLPDEMSTAQDETCASDGSSASDKNHTSRRQKLLCRIRSLSPDLLVFGELNARINVPTSFLTRFKETLQLFGSVFEMMETTMEEREERQVTESVSTKWILNVVACEGADRVIRPETYQRWQRRLERAGFQQLQVPERLLERSAAYVRNRYHRDFTVMEDDKAPWLLLGWRGRTFLATSAWKPTANPTS